MSHTDDSQKADVSIKVVRRQRKAAVTRCLGTIKRFIVQRKPGSVRDTLIKLEEAFGRLEEAHDLYHNGLTSEDDIEESEHWFMLAENEYIKGVESANEYLDVMQPVAGMVSPPVEGSTHGDRASELINLLSIPKIELDSFDGDPLQY